MKKNRPHPVFYAFGILMIMGVVYQGNPHHYFPFINKDKGNGSQRESSSLPSSLPGFSTGSTSRSSSASIHDDQHFAHVEGQDSKNKPLMSTTGSSTSTTYQKNQYGFEEKVGSVKKSGNGKYEVYEKNKYGFEERVGSIKQQSPKSENYDTFRKNKYGFEEKTGSIKQVSKDRKEIYEKNKYGFEEKVGSMRKNYSGGYDVYRKNQYGFEEKDSWMNPLLVSERAGVSRNMSVMVVAEEMFQSLMS